MDVSEKGARLEFDCAHGSIDAAIALDADGRFRADGVIVREHPGPVRVGREPKAEPAVYSDTSTATP